MSDANNIINIKKLRSGDVILEITADVSHETLKRLIKKLMQIIFQLFLPIFSFFDKLAEKRRLVVSAVGLGIGLGLSIIVTQRPDTLQAFPVLSDKITIGVQASAVRIPKINLYIEVKYDDLENFTDNITTSKLVHIKGSGLLGQNKPTVIADLSSRNLLNNIDKINIGDEISVIGKNNGIYKYRVVEIRETQAQYLSHIIVKEENSLIIYKPTNLLRTQLFVIIAKPQIKE